MKKQKNPQKKKDPSLEPLPDADERYYRMTVHKSGEYRYASTQPQFLDPKTGKKVSRHIHWGTLDDNNRFFPNKRYVEASSEERLKLVFPEDWDLSEILNVSAEDLKSATQRDIRYREMMRGFQPEKIPNISTAMIFRIIHKLKDSGVESDRILDVLISLEES